MLFNNLTKFKYLLCARHHADVTEREGEQDSLTGKGDSSAIAITV